MASTGLLGFNPYYKGTKIDLSKPVNLAIQLQQKENAKAEALEKYFMDYEKSINGKGLGKGEGEVFTKKYNQIRDYWIQNKDAILHPAKYGYDAQSTYLAGLKDTLGYVDQAKQATAERKAFVDYINKQKASGKHISDNYLEVVNNAMRPVGAGYVAPDLSQIRIFDPHDDVAFVDKTWKGIDLPGNIITEKEFINKKPTGRERQLMQESITGDVANAYDQRARGYYRSNEGTQEKYNILFQDKDFVKQLNPTFRKYLNKDISNPEDLLVAQGLASKFPKREAKGEFAIPDPSWREKFNLTQGAINERADREAGTQEHIFDQFGSGGQPINLGSDKAKNSYKIIQGQVVDQNGNPATITTTITGENLPKDFFDIISKDSPNKLSADMDYTITSKNGKITNIKTESGNIDRSTAREKQQRYDKKIKIAPESLLGENVQELKGSVNPKNLKKGNKYKVEGVVYTFDGRNLIP